MVGRDSAKRLTVLVTSFSHCTVVEAVEGREAVFAPIVLICRGTHTQLLDSIID